MTITIDWGAVVAMGVVGTATVAVTRLFVRDEIRKVTNGKFARIDDRLTDLEIEAGKKQQHGHQKRRLSTQP